jgi:hydrogenase expression/formation protein HypD
MKADEVAAREHLDGISDLAREIGRRVTVMEVCGGHTNVVMRYGIRGLLPENVRLISGPGCPVCVSAQRDIDCMISLASSGVHVATYGDMLRVPGTSDTLERVKARTGNVHEVYSAEEAIPLSRKHPGLVFFGVGFETTAPMTAYLLTRGVPVYSVHKLVPPALEALLAGSISVDGFIDPGHVSTIIGARAYGRVKAPQVISGFTPERILRGLRMLLELIRDGRCDVVNGYPEAVTEEGNRAAQRLVGKAFRVCDSEWRGLGVIAASGLEVRDDALNAKRIHAGLFDQERPPKEGGCRCGDVLKGLIEPPQCPLYMRSCTPDEPRGACMVSAEGTCSISARYGR